MSVIKQGLAEFIAEKQALEQRLRIHIMSELSAFTALTGATVDHINVSFMTLQCIGMPAERTVSSVRVSTPLD